MICGHSGRGSTVCRLTFLGRSSSSQVSPILVLVPHLGLLRVCHPCGALEVFFQGQRTTVAVGRVNSVAQCELGPVGFVDMHQEFKACGCFLKQEFSHAADLVLSSLAQQYSWLCKENFLLACTFN